MPWLHGKSTFESAIDDGHGAVDAGYLGMMQFTRLAIGSIMSMIVGLAVQAYFDVDHKFDALMLGQGAGLIAAAYGVLVAAVGGFKRLDQSVPLPAGSSSVTVREEQHGPAVNPLATPLPVKVVESARNPVTTREVGYATQKARRKTKTRYAAKKAKSHR